VACYEKRGKRLEQRDVAAEFALHGSDDAVGAARNFTFDAKRLLLLSREKTDYRQCQTAGENRCRGTTPGSWNHGHAVSS